MPLLQKWQKCYVGGYLYQIRYAITNLSVPTLSPPLKASPVLMNKLAKKGSQLRNDSLKATPSTPT